MIEQTDIDGVPTLLSPADGPLRGGITFRVGHADETLARSGITHLVEHLALHSLGLTDYHFNGLTGSTVTHFVSQGTPSDVGEYVNKICAALTDLPFDRLEVEKEVLRTEAAGRGSSPLLLWRYGARGYGLASYPEWGLAGLTADDLRAWIGSHFTRENAVLWFTGSAPTNLRLTLPSGSRRPLPATTSTLPRTPAYFSGPPRVVALHTIVARSAAAQVLAGVLERELFRSLRQEGGYSYAADAAYHPHDGQLGTITAVVDAHPDKQDAALGGFIDALARLQVGRVEQSDIDAILTQARESLRDSDYDAARLPSLAFDFLINRPLRTVETVATEIDAVTVEDVRAVAREAVTNGLLMTPAGHRADWAGYVAAPTNSTGTVAGRRYAMHKRADHALVVGPEGVSITSPGSVATVRFAECAAALAYPDGGRVLIGEDGITCVIEPTLYPAEASDLRLIDDAIRPDHLVRLPSRSKDAIPRPSAPPRAAGRQHRRQRFDHATPWIAAALLVIGLVSLVGFSIEVARPLADRNDAMIGVYFIPMILVWIPMILFFQRAIRLRQAARAVRLRLERAEAANQPS